MQAKCQDLIAAVQAAYALADQGGRQYNGQGDILKIFVAPEFFFRGRNGAYDHALVHGVRKQTDDKGNVVLAQSMGIVERMRQELDNPIYKDWLFVLGTAIAASKETKTSCLQSGCSGKIVFDVNKATGRSTPRCSVDRNHNVGEKTLGAFIENVAFIVKEKEVHTVSKELVSHVDFKGHS